jgi:hypothetical protein
MERSNRKENLLDSSGARAFAEEVFDVQPEPVCGALHDEAGSLEVEAADECDGASADGERAGVKRRRFSAAPIRVASLG